MYQIKYKESVTLHTRSRIDQTTISSTNIHQDKNLKVVIKSEGYPIVWSENRRLLIGIKFTGREVNSFVNELNFFPHEKLTDGVIFTKSTAA